MTYSVKTPQDYQAAADNTKSCDYQKIGNCLKQNLTVDLLHAVIGLTTEVGEFADPIKKHIFYGKQLDKENLHEELGDICWYLAIACNALSFDLMEVMQQNIAKLLVRYLNAEYSDEAAEARADKRVE